MQTETKPRSRFFRFVGVDIYLCNKCICMFSDIFAFYLNMSTVFFLILIIY